MVKKSYKMRIYPNNEQISMIDNNFIAAHRGWNYLLGFCKDIYGTIVVHGSSILVKQDLSKFSLGKIYTQLKKNTQSGYDTPIIPPSDSRIKSSISTSLSNSFKRFFQGTGGYPKFKSKKNIKYTYTTDYSSGSKKIIDKIKGNKIFIPKLKYVKFKNSYKVLIGDITSLTITKEGRKYLLSINCKNVPVNDLLKTGKEIGIDPNSKKLSFNNGVEKDNPKPDLTLQKRKKFLNKSLSRKNSKSRAFKKVKYTLQKFYRKIKHVREDYNNKLSTDIIKEYDIVAFEDTQNANVNKFLSGHWNDNGYYNLRKKLSYKAEWYGKEYHEVDPYNTTQRCSKCGHIGKIKVKIGKTYIIKDKVDKTVKMWVCPKCNSKHHRDINAAQNILDKALNRWTVGNSSLNLNSKRSLLA